MTTEAPVNLFSPDDLHQAVNDLFSMNNYEVRSNVHVHGAQIDLVARSKTDQFAPAVYIEVTTEFVKTAKYGKDATKFLLVRSKDPSCACLCISSNGFTAEVVERARASSVRTMTYMELFRSFEKFESYAERILNDVSVRDFDVIYEEPLFSDAKGVHLATNWLNDWRASTAPETRWLIVLGEYGTGKTSLTRILQYRWLSDYMINPAHPIPFRIELRNFTRQFDARTLVHHFLDHNGLGHLPIEFIFHLMRRGRVLLLLDGYDEMAQFLNARERRTCLSALADLASEGARGLLTSRPNYFSETEELRVVEALYDSIRENRYFLGNTERSYIENEQRLDSLLENYLINRYERYIRDLTPEQTEGLVRRKLVTDPQGQEIVLRLLRRVFRAEADGTKQSLSGKPVIIAYLLELIDDIRRRQQATSSELPEDLTEWQIYRMIVDRLMLRDFQRSPLDPNKRRYFLKSLAVALSGREAGLAQAETFYNLIERVFAQDFRFMDPEERGRRREELFEDLRTSATLTRSEGGGTSGWQFSHNSLREYLVAEYLVAALQARTPASIGIPISSAMRSFVASLPDAELQKLITTLWEVWHVPASRRDMGGYLTLFWTGICKLSGQAPFEGGLWGLPADANIPLDGIRLGGIDLEAALSASTPVAINGASSEFTEVSLRGLDLRGSDFSGAVFDSALFRGCRVSGVSFANALLYECDMTDVDVTGADFTGLDAASSLLLFRTGEPVRRLIGARAVGYLAYHGAYTDPVDEFYRWQHHPRFLVVMKICERVMAQKNSQLRGLTQRGEAHDDPPLARAFVQHLKQKGLITIGRNELVTATPEGRQIIPLLVEHNSLPPEIAQFFQNRP